MNDRPWIFQLENDYGRRSADAASGNATISHRVHTFSVMIEEEGKTRGLKDKLRGQIGLKTSALKDGWTIGPPADKEYAVDPVGVETIRPSDSYQLSIHVSLHLKTMRNPPLLL